MKSEMSMHFFFALASLLLLSGGGWPEVEAAAGAAVDSSEESLRKVHDKVFAELGPALEPDQTLELMKELYKILDARAEQEEKKLLVKDMIDERQQLDKGTDGLGCLKDDFLQLDTMIETVSPNYWNIMAYLEDIRRKKFVLCKDELKELIEIGLDAMEPKEKKDMLALRKAILEPSTGDPKVAWPYLNVPREYILRGILSFMEQQIRPFNKKELLADKDLFAKKYLVAIGGTCVLPTSTLEMPMAVYNLVVRDEDVLESLDEQTLVWITNARLCHRMLVDNSYASDAYGHLSRSAAAGKSKIFSG